MKQKNTDCNKYFKIFKKLFLVGTCALYPSLIKILLILIIVWLKVVVYILAWVLAGHFDQSFLRLVLLFLVFFLFLLTEVVFLVFVVD